MHFKEKSYSILPTSGACTARLLRIAVLFILWVLPFQPANGQTSSISLPHLGVGISNGLRLGWMQFPGAIGWEASVGWMPMESTRMILTSEGSRVEETLRSNGVAFSGGVNILTHPGNDISGLLGLSAGMVWVPDPVKDLNQSRGILTLSFGSLLYPESWLMVFFRTGPTVHFLSQDEGGATQFFLQFDGGIGFRF